MGSPLDWLGRPMGPSPKRGSPDPIPLQAVISIPLPYMPAQVETEKKAS